MCYIHPRSFLSTVYLIVINSELLSYAGLPREAAVVSNCLAACLGSLLIGFGANLPFVVAPGLGLGAYFVYHVVTHMGYSFAAANACVLLTGLAFTALSFAGALEWSLKPVPRSVRVGLVLGLGLLLCFLGLLIGRFLALDAATLVRGSSASAQHALATFAAVIVTAALLHARVPGALLGGIALIALLTPLLPDPAAAAAALSTGAAAAGAGASDAAAAAARAAAPAWTQTFRLPWSAKPGAYSDIVAATNSGVPVAAGTVFHSLAFGELAAGAALVVLAMIIAGASDVLAASYGLRRMCGLLPTYRRVSAHGHGVAPEHEKVRLDSK